MAKLKWDTAAQHQRMSRYGSLTIQDERKEERLKDERVNKLLAKAVSNAKPPRGRKAKTKWYAKQRADARDRALQTEAWLLRKRGHF
jgi:hypothetical protein